jgi:hypothetical protein
MFVDFGVIIGTRITVNSDCFFSFVIAHGTWALAYPKFTSIPQMLVP